MSSKNNKHLLKSLNKKLLDNYDPFANFDDGSCLYYGCTDTNAINLTPGANFDDGSCEYTCVYQGYAGQLLIDMHDSFGDSWNGSVLYITNINGDTLNTGGSSVTSGAGEDDSLCIYTGCYEVNVTANPWNGEVSWELVLDGDTLLEVGSPGSPGTWQLEVGTGACNLGCTDPAANNYDANAVTDNGSCMYSCTDNVFTLNMTDLGGGWGGSQWDMYDGSGNLVASNTFSGVFNSWDTLCLADGCYNLVVTSGANNGGVFWSLTDGSGNVTVAGGAPYADTLCFPAVGGCMDPGACNYDALATIDNLSCDYSCVGCTDSTSLNWSGPSFTIDDGSCLYCNLTGSSVVGDASANGAANGFIDFTPVGSYCNTDSLDLSDANVIPAGGSGPWVMTFASTAQSYIMKIYEVDDTIHFLAKYRQELISNNGAIRNSVFASLKETGVSMLYTSVVLFFGFFIFIASDFGGTVALGLLVAITLLIAMLSNLLLLPALLLTYEKKLMGAFVDPKKIKN